LACPAGSPRPRSPCGCHPPRQSPRTVSLDPRARCRLPRGSAPAAPHGLRTLVSPGRSPARFPSSVMVRVASSSCRCRWLAFRTHRSARTVVDQAEAPARQRWGSIVPRSPGHPARQGRQSALFLCLPPRSPAVADTAGELRRGHPRLGGSRSPLSPSIDIIASRPLQGVCRRTGRAPFGSGQPWPKSRSVLVVSHHLDGFLRETTCGLVASRCRSWGSSRFPAPPLVAFRRRRRAFAVPRNVYHPSECSPAPQP